jgi:bacillithiol system protein YtxJ
MRTLDLQSLDDIIASPLAVLFKHSTQCPTSAAAYKEVERFTAAYPDAPVYLIKVIEERTVSDAIAKRTGVTHESPQVIIVADGTVVYTASHDDITAAEIEEQLVEFR